ncbi:MAG: glycosyltransferase family 4 protein [Patescibacteria group bacterium]|nr:glycosyltransferase family 4 protein [Patescibacteria group bacterium]
MGKIKVAYFDNHPNQYRAPLLRLLAQQKNIDLKVFYYDNFGVQLKLDKDFGYKYLFDIDVTGGYKYKILNNFNLRFLSGILIFNPYLFNVLKKLKQEKTKVIIFHSYFYPSSFVLRFFKFSHHIPLVFYDESTNLKKRTGFKNWLRKKYLKWFYHGMDAILLPGKANFEHEKSLGVPKKKLFIANYTVDVNRFRQTCRRLNKRRNKKILGFNQKKLIIFSGKYIKRKGIIYLLQAFKNLVRKDNNLGLVLIGDGPEKKIYQQFISDNKIKNKVYLTGFINQKELPKYYKVGDIFVLPSLEENYGLVINEAMACGLPIITTKNVGASYDLVESGRNGFVIKPADSFELQKALKKILIQPKTYAKESAKVIKQWTYKQTIKSIIKALDFVRDKQQ